MTQRQREICETMYRALRNLPCGCQHNVPYEGGQVKRLLTRECQRCRAISQYEAFVQVTA